MSKMIFRLIQTMALHLFPRIALFMILVCPVALAGNDNLVQPIKPDVTDQKQIAQEAIHILGGNLNVISQWVDSVRIATIGEIDATTMKSLKSVVVDVAQDTQRDVKIISHRFQDASQFLASLEQKSSFALFNCDNLRDAECANFVVVISSIPLMQRIAAAIPMRDVYREALSGADDLVCFFSPVSSTGRVISGGLVFIRQDLSEALTRTCLYEEIYQSFGLFNDYTNSQYFSFNNLVQPKEITFYDRALLRAVYSEDFKPGTPAFTVVNRLMEKLDFEPYWQ